MSEPRIPPRPRADWDAEVADALSVLRPPASAARPAKDAARPIPNILGTFTWHPALAKAFLVFNKHLFASILNERDRWLVTVRVSWLRRGTCAPTCSAACGRSPSTSRSGMMRYMATTEPTASTEAESKRPWEIRINRDLCMGSGQCLGYAPNTFDQDDDNTAIVIDSRGDPEEDVQTAVASCPARALSLVPADENAPG